MPTYDYHCTDCKTEFSIERSMTDESPQPCLSCNSPKANRIWNVFILSSGTASNSTAASEVSATPKAKRGGCGTCSSHACGTCH